MAVRVLLADDDTSIRRLLRRLIEARQGWMVCGEAGDGHEAFDKTEQLTPDIVALDLAMPDMNGFQAAREISRHLPDLPLLFVTVQQLSSQLTSQARNARFRGALSKNTASEVVDAIAAQLNHQNFFEAPGNDAMECW